ncbi:MAG TPA: hypothetical protein VEY88_17175 [Archangium sp.]|nr:hypothetical protein [Archangium sp.]
MALDVKFSYVCPRKFAELRGEGNLSRFCDECRLEVHNLDPLDDHQRLAFFERMAASGERLCVAATVPIENATPCATTSPKGAPPSVTVVPGNFRPNVPLAGAPRVPTPQQLQAERERLKGQGPKKAD